MAKKAELPSAEILLGRQPKIQKSKVLKHQSTSKIQASIYFSPEILKALETAKAKLFAEHNIKVTKSEIVERAVEKAISDIDSLSKILV